VGGAAEGTRPSTPGSAEPPTEDGGTLQGSREPIVKESDMLKMVLSGVGLWGSSPSERLLRALRMYGGEYAHRILANLG